MKTYKKQILIWVLIMIFILLLLFILLKPNTIDKIRESQINMSIKKIHFLDKQIEQQKTILSKLIYEKRYSEKCIDLNQYQWQVFDCNNIEIKISDFKN